jgi:hypothetical protein
VLGRFVGDVRRNHALEHATVQLLIARLGPELRLVGRASGDGFRLYGYVPAQALAECTREALNRLQRGEAHWAVTPLCGTNLATAGILASLATLLVASRTKEKVANGIAAGIAAVTVAQPLGRIIQEKLTTSPDLADTELVAIESRADSRYHRIRTRRIPGLAQATGLSGVTPASL